MLLVILVSAAPPQALLAAVALLRHDKVLSVWSGDLLSPAGEGLCKRLGLCCVALGKLTHPVLVQGARAPQVMLFVKLGCFGGSAIPHHNKRLSDRVYVTVTPALRCWHL